MTVERLLTFEEAAEDLLRGVGSRLLLPWLLRVGLAGSFGTAEQAG